MLSKNGKYPYRIELHAHTYPVSRCASLSPEELISRYAARGIDGVVVTNHFIEDNFPAGASREEAIADYLSGYRAAHAAGERLGVRVYLGAELRFSDTGYNDYLLYGLREEEIALCYDLLPLGYASFCRRFPREGHVLVQAHPFRNGSQEIDRAPLDGIEVWNMHAVHNSRVAVAAAYAKREGMIVTGGSDCHDAGGEGLCLFRTASLPEDSRELAAAIASRDCRFEIGGATLDPYGIE